VKFKSSFINVREIFSRALYLSVKKAYFMTSRENKNKKGKREKEFHAF